LEYKKYYNLPVVVYVCEAYSVLVRKNKKLRVFENKELREIFGPR
jgi:hypothetical protein